MSERPDRGKSRLHLGARSAPRLTSVTRDAGSEVVSWLQRNACIVALAAQGAAVGYDSRGVVLAEAGATRVVSLGPPPLASRPVLPNQYLVCSAQRVALVDPGGTRTLSWILHGGARFGDLRAVDWICLSHVDPDVVAGLPRLAAALPGRIAIGERWTRFLLHLNGVAPERVTALSEHGGAVVLGETEIAVLPCHFLHAASAQAFFEPATRTLFSGDLGSSFVAPGSRGRVTSVLEPLLSTLIPFHRRHMASRAVVRAFLDGVRALQPRLIAPHHGPALEGAAVGELIELLSDLECGLDIIEEIYGEP